MMEQNEGMLVKVMTDEQMEVLRKQIAIYATICEQLVELHKSLTCHHDLSGVRVGNIYTDSGAHKISARQRWTPTPVQLQILERLFEQGNGTPTKQKIKEITSQLSQHGHISVTNVYNWFQNRRARSKKKQHLSATNNNNAAAESEVETEVESPKPQQNPTSLVNDNNVCFPNPNLDQTAKKASDVASNLPENAGQMSYYGALYANPKGTSYNAAMDRLIGKIEVPGSYQSYMQGEHNNMTS